VVRDKTKKDDAMEQLYYTTQTNFHGVTKQKHSPYSWNFVRDYKTTSQFFDDESEKNFRLIFE
jgi:hypothetical protein